MKRMPNPAILATQEFMDREDILSARTTRRFVQIKFYHILLYTKRQFNNCRFLLLYFIGHARKAKKYCLASTGSIAAYKSITSCAFIGKGGGRSESDNDSCLYSDFVSPLSSLYTSE
jgi:hypothetical protein